MFLRLILSSRCGSSQIWIQDFDEHCCLYAMNRALSILKTKETFES